MVPQLRKQHNQVLARVALVSVGGFRVSWQQGHHLEAIRPTLNVPGHNASAAKKAS